MPTLEQVLQTSGVHMREVELKSPEQLEVQAIEVCESIANRTRQSHSQSMPKCELPTRQRSAETVTPGHGSCGGHYKQLAFAIPFFAVTAVYSGGDLNPTSCGMALVAGTLAGTMSYGLYRAIKIVRHRGC